MPFVNVKTNQNILQDQELQIKESIGKAITAIPGKSETWLMVNLEANQNLYFQGKKDPAAYVEVKLYGGENAKAFDDFTTLVTKILSQILSIPSQKVYVSYFTTPHWGYNGSNF